MSLLSKLWKGVRGTVAPLIGGAVGGPLGAVLGSALGGSSVKSVGQVPAAPQRFSDVIAPSSRPGAGFQPVMASRAMLPSLRGGLAGAGGLVGPVMRGAGAVMRSANTYCRRHPAWCATLPGGVTAIASMIEGGQLPPIKRRRAKGITGTELKNFKRVSRVLNTWCKVPAPTQRARRKC